MNKESQGTITHKDGRRRGERVVQRSLEGGDSLEEKKLAQAADSFLPSQSIEMMDG